MDFQVVVNCILRVLWIPGVGLTLLVMSTALVRNDLESVSHLALELLSMSKIVSLVSRSFRMNVSLRYSDGFQVAKREAQVLVCQKDGLCLSVAFAKMTLNLV
jgi:hypothetical protein